MGQEYSSLSMEERVQLGLLASQKLSQRQIAAQLGRSPATISRVQAKAGMRKLGARFDTPLGKFVRHELQRALSPEQIAGRLKRMHPEDPTQRVSHETIYQAVYMVG